MVQLRTQGKNSFITNISLFDFAANLPRRFNDREQTVPIAQQTYMQGTPNLMDSLKAKGAQSFKMAQLPDIDAYSTLTIPLMLKEAYDKVKSPKPDVQFYSIVKYTDPKNNQRPLCALYDAEAGHNDEAKQSLDKYAHSHGMQAYVVVASKDREINLPAADMARTLGEIKKDMFDKARYESIELDTTAGQRAQCQKVFMDPGSPASRLFKPMARVYGGHVYDLEGGGEFITQQLYEAFKEGELSSGRIRKPQPDDKK